MRVTKNYVIKATIFNWQFAEILSNSFAPRLHLDGGLKIAE